MSEPKVYVSITTIYSRQRLCSKTLQSLLQQSLQPTKLFLFVSQKPYLLDKGIRQYCLEPSLTELTMKYKQLEVEWVENEGPFRKLLPALKKLWSSDNTLIITCDDDVIYKKDFLKTAVDLWKEKRCCIGFEGSRMNNTFQYNSFEDAKGTQHLWNIAKGVGGIVYEAKWFTNKDIFNWKEFPYNDDLWFTAWRIAAGIDCYIHSSSSIDRTLVIPENESLWSRYNATGNSDYLEKIIHLFVYLGYIQQDDFFSKESQLLFEWNRYIVEHLLPIVGSEKLEGSIWNKHLSNKPDMNMFSKQRNILKIAKQLTGSACEVGFNAGFSAVLFLLANPTLHLTCLDLGEHSYTQKTFNKIKEDFGERLTLIVGDSQQTMKQLTGSYSFIHVDGGHTEQIARSDCQQALRLLEVKGKLLLDDTNLEGVQKGIQPFLKQLTELSLPYSFTEYKHTLYQKI